MSTLSYRGNPFNRTPPSGPFSLIAGRNAVQVSPFSSILKSTDLNDYLPIEGLGYDIGLSSDEETGSASTLNIWLEVTFIDGAPEKANIKNGADWWQKYPKTQEFVTTDSVAPSLDTQVGLYIPIATVGSSHSDNGSSSFTFGADDGLVYYRYVYNDLMIFQMCNSYIFLPMASSRAYSKLT